ncbi:unnamed protein product [Dovyalis caffra]|uniref:RING-type E3 ubiquitin transferase n=1 Tax=Dovyalis caffra TaxID=77055 RepID=A0AAV1RF13_9ROSI|nr:unnamed protein product [Dovyalis caffra]
MVFKKFVSCVYSLLDLRGHPRIKDAATACKGITLDVSDNINDSMLEPPVRSSSSSEIVDAEGEVCCVCLSSFKVEKDMSVLPCLHKFHKVCIEGWFNNMCRKTCPLCRFSMGEQERSYKREEQFTEEMNTLNKKPINFFGQNPATFWHD